MSKGVSMSRTGEGLGSPPRHAVVLSLLPDSLPAMLPWLCVVLLWGKVEAPSELMWEVCSPSKRLWLMLLAGEHLCLLQLQVSFPPVLPVMSYGWCLLK